MAALTPDQISTIRDDVGDVSITTLQRTYDRVGTVEGTIVALLRAQLAPLLARPASFTIPGEYAENRAANIKALQDRIDQLAASAATTGALPEVVQLTPERHVFR